MTSRQTLEARRARAINRAITRAVQHPHSGGMELVTWLRGEPLEVFDTELADIRVERRRRHADPLGPAEDYTSYWVDGAHDSGFRDAVALIQDRYGVTYEEAEELIAAADTTAPSRPYARPSSVTPISR